ncbi:thiamine phosphate synthase [Methylocystis sp. SB2]|uniref:thiamine phosphate synthase n=1 Tax=Methylocystis sp. (strain SB2) TaxID=743836 RepID=UPI00041C2AD9|nr:thiamine phosphate synthase [Methylocystis sp. SB2]ULO22624.1 thiamine phosphate synthase [Methylocystis sp. SB2]
MAALRLDPFYLIVDDADWLSRLLPQGVKLVQLRVKDRAEPDLRAQIATARGVCARHGAQLVVNDYWRLAIEEGCDFVHLGQSDLDAADIPALRRAGVRIGVSTHDQTELDRALSVGADYVALGPIYPTLLKQMAFAPQGLARLGAWKAQIGETPLVAIGGLTPERAIAALAAGADSACVVTDILRSADPEARARDWLSATQPWREREGFFEPDHLGASVCPSPNHGERLRPISSLVLHYTGMPTGESALALLCSLRSQVSAHYVVEEDGRVLQLVPESRRSWHAGISFWAGETDMNSASIGIEIVHPGHDDPRHYPAVQIEATAALAKDICRRHAIPPERVLAHSDIAPGRKRDPGEFFPWEALARLGVGRVADENLGAGATTVSLGDAGAKVASLQRDLAAYGYRVEQTGVYDAQTVLAVEAFQRHFRRAQVDGRADGETRVALANLLATLGERV